MSRKAHVRMLAAIAIVALLVSLTVVQGALASEGGYTVTPTAAVGPDITVVIKANGDRVGGASVYVDDVLAGTTDSKGNLTLKEAPAAGNHTLKVTKRGLQDATMTTDFSAKPVMVTMNPTNGKTVTLHVTDKNTKEPIADKAIYIGQYELGTTDASGDLVINDYPKGFFMPKFSAYGYQPTSVFMVVYSSKTQNVALTPAEAANTGEH